MHEHEDSPYPLYHLGDGRIFDPLSGEIREGYHTLVQLPPKRAKLLEALIRSPDEVVTYDELLRSIYPDEVQADYLDKQRLLLLVRNIRLQLEETAPSLSQRLENFPQSGYRWRMNIIPVEG